ncbi:MAG TPA: hypothetical protein VFN57_14850, partial [Thermomicrobiaceae bacterium]|nr:hypothetical protein [Thermomicrobiaceae bacterium]
MTAPADRTTSAGPRAVGPASAPAIDLPARFMLVSMLALLVVALAAPVGLPLLLGSTADPRLLAFLHLNTLGVVAVMVVGASYQLVPVVLQTPLAAPAAGRVSFWLLLAGVGLFVPGLFTFWLPAVASGATLLLAGFGVYVVVLGVTVRRAPRRDLVAWHIAAALVSLGAGVVLGVLLAINLATGLLGGMTGRLLAAHVTLMLAGWIGVLLPGVAYRLVGMFTLAKERLWSPLTWVALPLAAVGAWLVALGFALGLGAPFPQLGAVGILAGQGAFAGQLVALYHQRRRRTFDVSRPFVLLAGVMGVASAALLVAGLARGASPGDRLWVAVVWIALAGFAETAIQGFFYKIATFLVWLHRYAPLAGRERVPRLEELYRRRLALVGWAGWLAGLLLSLASVASGDVLLA